jgi:hypothetical protein
LSLDELRETLAGELQSLAGAIRTGQRIENALRR